MCGEFQTVLKRELFSRSLVLLRCFCWRLTHAFSTVTTQPTRKWIICFRFVSVGYNLSQSPYSSSSGAKICSGPATMDTIYTFPILLDTTKSATNPGFSSFICQCSFMMTNYWNSRHCIQECLNNIYDQWCYRLLNQNRSPLQCQTDYLNQWLASGRSGHKTEPSISLY